jgi:hypothetical protein
MEKAVFGIFAVMKLVKLVLSYVSIIIASNYTTQIYTEKVYVNQESPPKLINMLYLFIGIELIMSVIVLSCIGFMINFISQSNKLSVKLNILDVAVEFAQDYILYIISMLVCGAIIANTMYSKKYFLYKEDGLRGIRAFKKMLIELSLFNGLIPFNMFVKGIMSSISKLNKDETSVDIVESTTK